MAVSRRAVVVLPDCAPTPRAGGGTPRGGGRQASGGGGSGSGGDDTVAGDEAKGNDDEGMIEEEETTELQAGELSAVRNQKTKEGRRY